MMIIWFINTQRYMRFVYFSNNANIIKLVLLYFIT